MTADPIAAVTEVDAVGETAAVFDDLRTTLGLPFVNLIWRHLATIPGALPAIWRTVKPLYGSTVLHERVAGVEADARAVALDALPAHVWDALGVGSGDRRVVAAVIDDYNHANSVNFLVITTVAALLRDGGTGRRTADRPLVVAVRPSPTARTATPPLPPASALTAELRALVDDCDQLGRLGPGVAHASLYRHLALWPPFLATAYVSLLPLHRDGVLRTTQHRLLDRGREAAAGDLLPLLGTDLLDEALQGEARRAARAAVDEFASLMIGRMVVTGAAMRGLLGAPESAAAPTVRH